MSVPVVTLAVTVPVPVPEAGLRDNHAALSLADQLKVPPPVLLMVKVWAAGLPPPCWAVKYRVIGLTPITGLAVGVGDEGDEGGATRSPSPLISEANRRIDRPPDEPFPLEDESFVLAWATGAAIPVDDNVVDGAMLTPAVGKVIPGFLAGVGGSLDSTMGVVPIGETGGTGNELAVDGPIRVSSTTATGGR